LRTVHGANITYQATAGAGDFAANAAALQGANLIDTVLQAAMSGGTAKSGYDFTYDVSAAGVRPAVFSVIASPNSIGGVTATGTRHFAIATEGVIYAQAATAATTMVSAAGVLTPTGGTPLNN